MRYTCVYRRETFLVTVGVTVSVNLALRNARSLKVPRIESKARGAKLSTRYSHSRATDEKKLARKKTRRFVCAEKRKGRLSLYSLRRRFQLSRSRRGGGGGRGGREGGVSFPSAQTAKSRAEFLPPCPRFPPASPPEPSRISRGAFTGGSSFAAQRAGVPSFQAARLHLNP